MKNYVVVLFCYLLSFKSNAQNTFPSTGNVGIGTSSPAAPLEVYGNGIRVNTSGTKISGFANVINAGSWDMLAYSDDGAQVVLGGYRSAQFTRLGLFTTGLERLHIDSDGNVGIGTLFPTEKLSVNGNLRVRKVIVTQTAWSDYVFHKNYRLRPLQEVEQFIKDNGHLPDVPAEKEVINDGLNLGDNQAVLLRKIEELTLYIIEMKKEIEILKRKKQNG
ncbi:hypothetical protein [Sediminibacterium ginsengisoli]|uniref:Chaperone of endosialidase n=1 Tax=Sediminibacterium ginsengisoli TaxID=413434 RepID=A0A1T4NGR6_9BACT|nr:hypothetical protein [Sediminibacterium ginsengisoli]SJZ78551.1 hypothetical protein SAMN04488132_104255 [Sediminibacterium ginsengisoli]